MNNKFTTIEAENAAIEKRVWQTPTIEVISRDNVLSGNVPGQEGKASSPISGPHSTIHYNHQDS